MHRLWYLGSRTLFGKGLNLMPRGLKVACLLIANMILQNDIYCIILGYFDVSFVFLVCK